MTWSRTALWLAIMLMVLSNPVDARKKCTIHYYNTSKYYNPPLLVDIERKEIIYPDIVRGKQSVTLNSGTTVLASCPGTGNNLFEYSENSMNITCMDSWLFIDNNPQGKSWKDLRCHKKVESTLKSGGNCGRDSSVYHIGWDIRRNLYLRQISVCFNTKLETTVFVNHTIHGRFIGARVNSRLQSFFKSGAMFSEDPDDNYKNQVERVNQTLGSSNELFRQRNHYFSRGHLAPMGDFVLEAEKYATFHYINAVPQWHSINCGIWERLESSVRKMAKKREATLDVYTGTHGILKLPDGNGRPTEMLLGREKMPVPALMWKVIHNPAEHTAVAIVMVNYVERELLKSWVSKSCPNACSNSHFLKNFTYEASGRKAICCKVNRNFLHSIPELPYLGNVDLLE